MDEESVNQLEDLPKEQPKEYRIWSIVKYIPYASVLYGLPRLFYYAFKRDMYQSLDSLACIVASVIGIVFTFLMPQQCKAVYIGLSGIPSNAWHNFLTFAIQMLIGSGLHNLIIAVAGVALEVRYEPEKYKHLYPLKVENIIYEKFFKHLVWIGPIYSISRIMIHVISTDGDRNLARRMIFRIIIAFGIAVLICYLVTKLSDYNVCHL